MKSNTAMFLYADELEVSSVSGTLTLKDKPKHTYGLERLIIYFPEEHGEPLPRMLFNMITESPRAVAALNGVIDAACNILSNERDADAIRERIVAAMSEGMV